MQPTGFMPNASMFATSFEELVKAYNKNPTKEPMVNSPKSPPQVGSHMVKAPPKSPIESQASCDSPCSTGSRLEVWRRELKNYDCRHCPTVTTNTTTTPLAIKIQQLQRTQMHDAILAELQRLSMEGYGQELVGGDVVQGIGDVAGGDVKLHNYFQIFSEDGSDDDDEAPTTDDQDVNEPGRRVQPAMVSEPHSLGLQPGLATHNPTGPASPCTPPYGGRYLHKNIDVEAPRRTNQLPEPPASLKSASNDKKTNRPKKLTKNQRKNKQRRAKKQKVEGEDQRECPDAASESEDGSGSDMIGMEVRTRSGRMGMVIEHHPSDELLEFKISFADDLLPATDWLSSVDVFSREGNDICTGMAYETALLPESTHVDFSQCSGLPNFDKNGNATPNADLDQGACGPPLGGLEPPIAVVTGRPVLPPVAKHPIGNPGGDLKCECYSNEPVVARTSSGSGRLDPPIEDSVATIGKATELPKEIEAQMNEPNSARHGAWKQIELIKQQLQEKQEQIDRLMAKMVGSTSTGDHQKKETEEEEEDPDDILFDLPTDEGIGDRYGLSEIPGGIGIDSCASDNVMPKRMLPGYTVKPSPGSQRGQEWGSASGHGIKNEGQVTYRFMTEHGDVAKGTTQIGAVRRPLAAVSSITKKAKKIAFFCEDNDWIIDRKDPVAQEIIKLVQKARMKTKVHEHKGTYRMRAWLVPQSGQMNRPALLVGRVPKKSLPRKTPMHA